MISCNRRDHISPVLASLHWLPVQFRVEFNILLLTYKALNDRAPSYLKDLIVRYFPNRAPSLPLRLGLKLSFLIKLIVRDGSGDPETSHS